MAPPFISAGNEPDAAHTHRFLVYFDKEGKSMGRTEERKPRLEHWQVIAVYLILYDIVVVNAAYFFALWVRFDCRYSAIPKEYLSASLMFAPVYTVFCIALFWRLRLYKSIWKFASYSELARVSGANIAASLFYVAGSTVLCHLAQGGFISYGRFKDQLPKNIPGRMPISCYVIGMMIQFILMLGIRFSYRFILLQRKRRGKEKADAYASRVMLIGAGSAGRMILRDLNVAKETNERVCCIIDDDSNKWNRFIDGVPIAGGRDTILKAVEDFHIEKIFVALPSAPTEDRREILNICKETGCELKNLPGMYQFVTGEITASAMKKVAVEDLLGRDPIKVDLGEIFKYLCGKTILVTGGGGSIGSELCRQIAGHEPKRLIIFDVYENNAYAIEQELKKNYPRLNLTVLIGSVRDSRRINQVFETYRPDVVYHAAAHKHVPLMETSPCEAIKNNAIGTYKTAYAAMMNGCQRFVLISTDKAVNPTNIMGASKRLCEMVIQSFDRMVKEGKAGKLPVLYGHKDDEYGEVGEDGEDRKDGEDGQSYQGGLNSQESLSSQESLNSQESLSSQGKQGIRSFKKMTICPKTEFVAVRFGNVLGSNGSVIPLFKKQIEAGGPVTVTHPDIIRYFMTIPEAVSLVLQAGTYAKGGEIFVLDMGAPVKIDTLARNLIKLSGFKPDVDIKIEYTGLRPGEKLYEEKLMAEEGMKTTPNRLIHVGTPIAFNVEEFLRQLEELMYASYGNSQDVHRLVKEMVPTYRHAGENGSEYKGKVYAKLVKGMEEMERMGKEQGSVKDERELKLG